MKLTLKKVKVFSSMSRETNCFNAVVCLDGKDIGTVENSGRGGPHRFFWFDSAVGRKVKEWAETQDLEFNFEKLDQIIDKMLAKDAELGQLKKWCKKATVFRLKGDASGSWRTIKALFEAKVKAYLVNAYGDKLERIANEEI